MMSLNQRITTLENNTGTGTGTGTTTIADVENLQTTLDLKQDSLTAGDNITISGNIISSTGGTTIDSTTDLTCNTLTTLSDVSIS
jgi:hypothetical protein